MDFFYFRVQKLHQRWVSVRTSLQNKLILVLSNKSFVQEERYVTRSTHTLTEQRLVDTNPHFLFIQECIEYVSSRLVSSHLHIHTIHRKIENKKSTLKLTYLSFFRK